MQAIANSATWRLGDANVDALAREVLQGPSVLVGVEAFLTRWCAQSPQPLVLLLDEVNALVGDTLISPITADLINQAKERLIVNRVTHLDQLADKLREDRVRRVIEPMLAGMALGGVPEDDIQYLIDLGLCRMVPGQGLTIANPIYREVLPRALAFTPQASLPQITPTWLNADGALNPERLLDAFLAFWRQHGQPLLGSAPYHEIAPHLVLMAFLHRVVNGDGTLEREYAIGSGRMDLCLRYGAVTLAMELKVWPEGDPDPLKAGLAQLDSYLNELGLETGWLVIFDRRSHQPPIAERTSSTEQTSPQGRRIQVIRA